MAKTLVEDKKLLQDLLDEWKKDTPVDKAAPNETIAEIGNLHAKYLRILSHHTLNIYEADKEYLTMKRLRVSYYNGSMTEAKLKELNWEPYLERAIKANSLMIEALSTDPFLLEITERKKVYELIVANCEKIIKELQSRHYSVSKFMDWEMKIRNG